MTSAKLTSSETKLLLSKGHRLKNLIGEGTYAKVILTEYTYQDVTNETRKLNLACKVTDTSSAPYDFVHKFLPREIQVLSRVRHPHIVHVHSILQRKSKFFVFMRQAERGDLLDFLKRAGAVEERLSRLWCRQLALALQYLHTMDIVHRDVKCENVLITQSLNAKLADFGFARWVDDAKGGLSETFCGSYAYVAPEVVKGKPYDPKMSDVWALGCVAFVMVNRAVPFEADNIRHAYEQQMSRTIKYKKKAYSQITPQLKIFIFNMLDPDLKTRWTIEEAVNSDWFSMDPRTCEMTHAEKSALGRALQVKRSQTPEKLPSINLGSVSKKDPALNVIKEDSNDDLGSFQYKDTVSSGGHRMSGTRPEVGFADRPTATKI